MVRIYKGDHEIDVSRNTYETMFKDLGYRIKEVKKASKSLDDTKTSKK